MFKNKKQLPKYETSAVANGFMNTQGMPYMGYAQAGTSLISGMSNNQNLSGKDKQQADAATMNNAADTTISSIPGWGQYYGLMKGASDLGRSFIKKDENGLAKNNWEQSADNFMKPTHTQVIDDVSKGQYGEAALSLVMNKGVASAIGGIAPNTEFGKKMTEFGQGKKIFADGGMNIQPNYKFTQFNTGGKMLGELTGYSEGGIIHAPEMGGYFRKRS